jgi:hypothetical protein
MYVSSTESVNTQQMKYTFSDFIVCYGSCGSCQSEPLDYHFQVMVAHVFIADIFLIFFWMCSSQNLYFLLEMHFLILVRNHTFVS